MNPINSYSLAPMSTGAALVDRAHHWTRWVIGGLDRLSPAVSLLFRIWVAIVFFKAGMTKIASWDSTLFLFTYEYNVPLLPPELAAFMGTGVELFFPVLLALGLATRFSALVLFLFNIIAVVSYPTLNEIGIKDHQYWGMMLLVPLFYGPGRVSLDALLSRYLGWKRPAGE